MTAPRTTGLFLNVEHLLLAKYIVMKKALNGLFS